MPYKIGLISLGCPKNQVDAEIMLAALEEKGFEIVDYVDGCDAVIINTCGFIDDAVKEAIENVLDMTELKDEGIVGKIIVTGCMAQRFGEEVLNEIPEVDAVLGIGCNGEMADIVRRVIEGEKIYSFPPKTDLPLCGQRLLTTPGHWAYLKIAEGCSNRCTYCTIPSIRGDFRSRDMENILEEARQLAQSGVKELIVIAQDTTKYGLDLYGGLKLPELLNRLSEIHEVTEELIDVIAENPKVLHYIDLPLQHIDDDILTAMNRRGTSDEIRALIEKLRERIPDVVIRTTFILGFPGEGEDEFENLASFVNEVEFDRLGCFSYSPQEGTPAAAMENQVDEETKQRRGEIIMQDQFEIVTLKNEQKIGKVYKVIVEDYDGYSDSYSGRTYMDAPEIDGEVKFTCPDNLENGDFVDVEIIGVNEYDLIGKTV